MQLSLEIGLNSIASYKRLSYTPWYAIAEFVDNSTQSFFNNRAILTEKVSSGRPLEVRVDYIFSEGKITIADNAMGMSLAELNDALVVAKPPKNSTGRSKYGMGLKTAACWIGNKWSIRTKKLGDTTEYYVYVDVMKISQGNNKLVTEEHPNRPMDEHYTIIEITDHNRIFKGRTIKKIQDYLCSMYRVDFRNKDLSLYWNGLSLDWVEIDHRLLTDKEGYVYKQEFSEKIEYDQKTFHINGWIGVLKDGSRKDAGFSIIHCGRVVKGWPDSWRPSTIFGQEQGSNDLVNQRLVGEIHLDAFEISQAKDDILWLGDQEELVEEKLGEISENYRNVALTFRKKEMDARGPSRLEKDAAVDAFTKELESSELRDVVNSDPMLTDDIVRSVYDPIKEMSVSEEDTYTAEIGTLTVKGYIDEMSVNDPYLTVDTSSRDKVLIIINSNHPHWNQLSGSEGVLNYLRHCTYDGIAEWQARQKVANLDPDTIKLLKDKLLRLYLDIEKHRIKNENLSSQE